MPITIGTTFWQCSCGRSLEIDGTELAQIGVPYCDNCGIEMEPEDDPIPTVLLIGGNFVGIALRSKSISFKEFEEMIVKLWKEWDKSESQMSFAEWAEEKHDTLFLASDHIINPKVH